jgi:hypothetical protein
MKIVVTAGALFPADGGQSFRLNNLENPLEDILVDGNEIKLDLPAPQAPRVDTRTPDQIAADQAAFNDRYGPGGGYDTPMGRRTFDESLNENKYLDLIAKLKEKGISRDHMNQGKYINDVAKVMTAVGYSDREIMNSIINDQDFLPDLMQATKSVKIDTGDFDDHDTDDEDQYTDSSSSEYYDDDYNNMEEGLEGMTNMRDPEAVAKMVAGKHGTKLKPLFDKYQAGFEQHMQDIRKYKATDPEFREKTKEYNQLVKEFQNAAISWAGHEMLEAGMNKTQVSNLLSGYGYFEDWISDYITAIGNKLKGVAEGMGDSLSQAQQFIDSNPTLRQHAEDIVLFNDKNGVGLKYLDKKALPDELYTKLELQFNVNGIDDFTDEEGEVIYYTLTPKHSPLETGVGLQSPMEEMIRKIVREMFDGRDNVTDVTGETL